LPTVRVEGNAVLFDLADKKIIGRYNLSASRSVAANSGPAIAKAFSEAVRGSIIKIVDWTNLTMPVAKRL
jgi:ABC-type uncharacterized transport system auxiliary subunit